MARNARTITFMAAALAGVLLFTFQPVTAEVSITTGLVRLPGHRGRLANRIDKNDQTVTPMATGALGSSPLLWARGVIAGLKTVFSADAGLASTQKLDPAPRAVGGKTIFPDGEDLPDDRFALFIGINEYPRMVGKNLDGCVNDARDLKSIFVNKFDFKRCATLINAQASRAGIHAAFTELIEQIKRVRRKSDKQITIVITYSGHGFRVIDDDTPEEEDDYLDETWCSADSAAPEDARNDIRDDELQVVYEQLARLNCQTIIISDSCHSGTMHRGSDKVRGVDREQPLAGPDDNLFDNFAVGKRDTRRNENEPLPGFAFYGACHERLRAYECTDANGKPCGKLTFVLRKLLPEVGPQTTYQELFDKIALTFEETWPGDPQTPYFHADPRKRGEVFMEGGRPERHASIVPESIEGNTLELTMGSIDGVAEGATFVFYSSLDDLKKRKDPLGTGTVTAVLPITCKVELDELVKLRKDAKAKLDMVRMVDLKVRVGKGTPKPIVEELEKLDRNSQLSLVQESHSYSIYPVPGQPGRVGIYRSIAEPDMAKPRGPQPHPLRTISYRVPEDAVDAVAENLLYLARALRLMSLEYGQDLLSVKQVPVKRNIRNELVEIKRPQVDGFLRLKDGDLFTLEVENLSPLPLYVTVFYVDAKNNVEIVFPERETDVDMVQKGKTLVVAGTTPFLATATDKEQLQAHGFERIKMKVVASSVRVDLTPLTIPPASGSRGPRKSASASGGPLFNLMGDVLLGGNATRVVRREKIPSLWATGTVVVDVEPIEKSSEL